MVTTPKKASFCLKIIGGIDFLQEKIHTLDFLEYLALQQLDLDKLNKLFLNLQNS